MPFTLRTIDRSDCYRSMPKTASVGTTTAPQTEDQSNSSESPDDGLQLTHTALLACIRQLGSLHDQSTQVIRCLYDELAEMDQRVQKLTDRLHAVSQRTSELPLPDADAESAGSLKRFLSIKRHFCSAKAEEYGDARTTNGTNLFLCESRPDSLRLLYARSSSREDYPSSLERSKTTDSFAVQTEPDEVFADDSSFSVDFRRPRPRRRSSFSADTLLPTPEEKVQKFVAACKPTTLEVDLPAAMLKRMSRKWTENSTNVQSQWKNATIADSEGTFGQLFYGTTISPKCAAVSVSPSQENGLDSLTDDEGISAAEENQDESVDLFQCAAAKEYLYDFAPFYRRQRIGGIKQFLSLRRPKSNSTPHRAHKSEYTSFSDSDGSCERWNKEKKERPEIHSHSKVPFDIANSIKCFLKKSFSFRSSSVARQASQKARTAGQAPLGSFDKKDTVVEKRLARNHRVNAKSSLPISTSSQVMNLATLLRRRASFKRPSYRCATMQPKPSSPRSSGDSAYLSGGEKRARPASIVSEESQISLGLGERMHSNTYHPGYQINYPEECTNSTATAPTALMASAVPNHVFAKQLNRVKHTTPSPSGSPSMRSNSSAVESNYSCDQEGYFTSMHHDCGVPMVRGSRRNCETGSTEVLRKADPRGSPSLAYHGSKPACHSSGTYGAWSHSRNMQKTPTQGPPPRQGNTPAVCRPVLFPRTAGLEVIMNRQGLSAAPVCHRGCKTCRQNRAIHCDGTKVPTVRANIAALNSQIPFRPQPAQKLLSPGAYGPTFTVVNPHAWSGLLPPGAMSPVPMDNHVYPLAYATRIENGAVNFETSSDLACAGQTAAPSLPSRNRRVVVAHAPPRTCSMTHYGNNPRDIGQAMHQPVQPLCEGGVSERKISIEEESSTKSEVAPPKGLEPFDQWLMAKFDVEEQETRLKEAKALEQAKLDALVDLQKLNLTSPDVGRRCKMEAALTNGLPIGGVRFLD